MSKLRPLQSASIKAAYSCGSIRDVEVYNYAYSELESVDSRPGLYAWYYVPTSKQGASYSFANHVAPVCNVSGIFGTRFTGSLEEDSGNQDHETDRSEAAGEAFNATLRQIALAFARPIYIGLSSDVRGRLLSHRRAIEAKKLEPAEAETLGSRFSPSPDTEAETNLFADRLTQQLSKCSVGLNELYVRVFFMQDKDLLAPLEHSLNRVYRPVLGRK